MKTIKPKPFYLTRSDGRKFKAVNMLFRGNFVPGYIVGEDGFVYSNKRTGNPENFEKIDAGLTGKCSYSRTQLSIEGKRYTIVTHRLVAESFAVKIVRPSEISKKSWQALPKDAIDYILGSLEVDHVNGDKFDNRPCNLEWVTSAENKRRSVAMGKHLSAA